MYINFNTPFSNIGCVSPSLRSLAASESEAMGSIWLPLLSLTVSSEVRKTVVIIGSSVANIYGNSDTATPGWAMLLAEHLQIRGDFELINVSQDGADTQITTNRFDSVVTPHNPSFVIIGLSLANEGLSDSAIGAD